MHIDETTIRWVVIIGVIVLYLIHKNWDTIKGMISCGKKEVEQKEEFDDGYETLRLPRGMITYDKRKNKMVINANMTVAGKVRTKRNSRSRK